MDNQNRAESGHDGPDRRAIDWDEVLQRNQRWLRTVVYARLGEPQAVDEVMQNVALAAVRQSTPLRDPSKAGPWLYRLAVRQALLYRRRRGRQRKLAQRYADRYGSVVQQRREPEPLDWLLRSERIRAVQDALKRLAPRDAEILLLKYGENWSYHQIAEQLGISHSAVESRLHRARARLRAELTVGEPAEMA